jgi:hypothetical protein
VNKQAVNEQSACMDGNEATARIAYRLSEVVSIYPITPASPMAEHCDDWAAAGRPNLWGAVPDVVEMQSEAGAAGALHGALQRGALATARPSSASSPLRLPLAYWEARSSLASPYATNRPARQLTRPPMAALDPRPRIEQVPTAARARRLTVVLWQSVARCAGVLRVVLSRDKNTRSCRRKDSYPNPTRAMGGLARARGRVNCTCPYRSYE